MSAAVRHMTKTKPADAPRRASPSRLADVAPQGAEHIVVYGATGRTGTHLVRCALDAGHTVRAFVRSAQKLDQAVGTHPRSEAFVADLRDERAVRAAMTGVSVAVCVAGATELADSDDMLRLLQRWTLATAAQISIQPYESNAGPSPRASAVARV